MNQPGPDSSNQDSDTETSYFECTKFIYTTFQSANNKGAEQTVWMRKLICAFVVRT